MSDIQSILPYFSLAISIITLNLLRSRKSLSGPPGAMGPAGIKGDKGEDCSCKRTMETLCNAPHPIAQPAAVPADALRWQALMREAVSGSVELRDGRWLNVDEPMSEWNMQMDMLAAAPSPGGKP